LNFRAMSDEESEHSGDESVTVEKKSEDRWFAAPEDLVELSAKPASRSVTYDAQKKDETELIFFTFPQNFDLKSLSGKSLKLPSKERSTVDIDGQIVCEGSEERVEEPCVLAPTKAMEYTHVVALFPTGDTSGAKWMVGKPFSSGYSIAAAATLKAESSASTAVAADDAKEAAADKKGKGKVRVKKPAKMTAVQDYGVGVKDAVLGEETEGNRTIDVVPLESLWSRWTAVGGNKRSREEQQQQQQKPKSDKPKKKNKKIAKEQQEQEEQEVVEEPKKKKTRKHAK